MKAGTAGDFCRRRKEGRAGRREKRDYERALLWEQTTGGGWEEVLDLGAAACHCGMPPFILVEALDINDSGWIIARGANDHAYLLRRVSDCPADLNGARRAAH